MSKQDRYEIIASLLTPVDKTAAVVTSQANCDGEIFITDDKQKLKALSTQKRHYADKVFNLKKEMKINPSWNGKALPRFVLEHPKYLSLVQLRTKLSELDVEINKHSKKVKPAKDISRFECDFVTMVRKKYPQIFEEVRDLLCKL